MSDSRLQELRRAWEASESVEDEAAYLRERVRAGELKPSAVELAAYAGHPAAERAAGQAASTAERAYAFCRGLLRWGPKPIAVALRGVLLFFEPDDEAGHEASARALEWFHSELELPDIGWFIPEVQGGLRRTREGSDLARTAFSLMSELTRPFYVDPELPEIRRASERSNWTASGQPTDWARSPACAGRALATGCTASSRRPGATWTWSTPPRVGNPRARPGPRPSPASSRPSTPCASSSSSAR